MTKREYLKALMQQPVEWLKGSAADPSKYMSRTHVVLHLIAIRRLNKSA